MCNGQLKNPDTNPSPESTGLQDQQDSTVGVCITPVAAGSSCKAGTGEAMHYALSKIVYMHVDAVCRMQLVM